MGPDKLLIIRHAEQHGEPGVTSDGVPDGESLTVRGWQRAGALVRRLLSVGIRKGGPVSVFASGVGPDSRTKRAQQTVEPLVAYLDANGGVDLCTTFLKPEVGLLMAEVMKRAGTVVIAWEHSRIPDCVASLPNPPRTPARWSNDRYDLIWILERRSESWDFREETQFVLAGDRDV